MNTAIRQAALLVALALLATAELPHAAGVECPAELPKPNIILIMADDLGWRDLHCYGNARLDTPALDQLAAEGVRFTDAYAADPVCSPTRAAMMTGQAPGRLRLTNHAPGHEDGFSLEGSRLQEAESVRHLALSYVTIAERLSEAGYTTAHIGKWHLSYNIAASHPHVVEKMKHIMVEARKGSEFTQSWPLPEHRREDIQLDNRTYRTIGEGEGY